MHPIFQAIANGQRQRVREFAGVEGIQDPAGRTPILWACSYLEPLIVADLLEARRATRNGDRAVVGEEHLIATVAAEPRIERFWRAQRTGAELSAEALTVAIRLLEGRALLSLKLLRAHGAAASPTALMSMCTEANEHGWAVVESWLQRGAVAALPVDTDTHLVRQASGWARHPGESASTHLTTDELLHELLLAGDIETVVWCHVRVPTSERRALKLEVGQLRGQFYAKFGTHRAFPEVRFADT